MSFQVSQSCATQSQHTYLYCWWIHHLAATHLVFHIQLRVQHINIIKRYLLICGIFRCGYLIICPYFYTITQTLLTMLFTPFACMVILQAVLFFLSNKSWCKPTSAQFFSKTRVHECLIFSRNYTWGHILGICSCKVDGMLLNKGKLENSIRFVFILYTLGSHTHQLFTQAFSWCSHLLCCPYY